jgi:Carboxypeptidase regulatory-like domain
MRRHAISVLFVAFACAWPNIAHAQSIIAGVVRDTSGAVLPGATVEVASDVLIEKTRSAVTDGDGQYRIIDLRPGTYVITFTLEGFQSTRRENLELPANFTATVNGELQVGSLQETITVSGQSPVVDVQSTSKSLPLPRQVLDSIPTGRTLQSFAGIVPGVNMSAPDVGGSRSMQQTTMSSHGMPSVQTVVQLDGIGLNETETDGGVQFYTNTAINEEMVYQTSGANADVDAGGIRLNMIPKRGGNQFSGSVSALGKVYQSDNLSQDLINRGLTVTDKIDTLYNLEAGVGGKIKQDRLWYFLSARLTRLNSPVADTFYVPSGSNFPTAFQQCKTGAVSCEQGIDDQYQLSGQGRVTWQVSPKNQLTAYYDKLSKNRGHAMSAGYDPATASNVWGPPKYEVKQGKWTSTISDKLLFEFGSSIVDDARTTLYQPGIAKDYGSSAWYANAAHVDTSLGISWLAAPAPEYRNWPHRVYLVTALSYVTGSHNVKVGFQHDSGNQGNQYTMNADLVQQYQNGTPSSVVAYNTPVINWANLNRNMGVYGQDSWTIKRLTLSYGLRWENWSTGVREQGMAPGRFVGLREFGPEDLPAWKTLSPRTGAAYDLFGNGKTALKFSANRYRRMGTTGLANTYNPIALQSQQLAWTDLNTDDIAQGERGCTYLTAGCEINFGQLATTFGAVIPGCSLVGTPGSIPCGNAQIDPDLKRTATWNYNVGVQHELLPRLSVSANWFHVDYDNLRVRKNVQQTFADYTRQDVVSPLDGKVITVYNVSNAKRNQVQYFDTNAPDRKLWYDGYEFTFSARLPRGGTLFGGTTTEKTLAVMCDEPSNPNNLLYCDQRNSGIPFTTSFKIAGSYPLPWGLQLSGALQAMAGLPMGTAALTGTTQNSATSTTPSGISSRWLILPTTRYAPNCTGPCTPGALVNPGMTVASMSVPLVAPGTEFFDRLNQLDVTISKVFFVDKVRFEPEAAVFNALNAASVSAVRSQNYGTTSYNQPSTILQGRFLRLGIKMRW